MVRDVIHGVGYDRLACPQGEADRSGLLERDAGVAPNEPARIGFSLTQYTPPLSGRALRSVGVRTERR
jgi:hypothetical protein